MNKSEPIGEWLKRQGRVHIRYGDAIELIQEIQAKRDNLGLELSEWVKFGDDVIGMVCDLFDIEDPVEGKNVLKRAEAIKEVKKLRAEQDKLGNSLDVAKYGILQGGISTLCRIFNITIEEVNG